MNEPVSGPIVAFYRGQSPDAEGRMLAEIQAWDDQQLEMVHNYIQWLFPLPTRSQFNWNAPLLDAAQIQAFHSDATLQASLLQSLDVMLRFYGFQRREHDGKPVIEQAANWPQQQANWLTPSNHNFLRLTRILACLHILDLPEVAHALLIALEKVYHSPAGQPIGSETFRYWQHSTLS